MYDLGVFFVNQGLSDVQIDKIKEFIDYYYGISEDTYIHDAKVQQIDKLSFLVSMKIENYDYCDSTCKLEPHTILVDDYGCCTEMKYPIINYINWNLILMTKEADVLIENQDNPEYYKRYSTVEKQAIMDNKGYILYEGELGDINKARLVNHYLLLEKDKYTDLQKEQIYFYCDNFIPGPYDFSDYMECFVCGNDAEWDEKEKCYICSECKTQIGGNHISEEEAIAIHKEALKKLAASDFSEVFNSEDVKAGKYISDTPEEREEREINEALCGEYNEENGIFHEQEPNYVEPYISGKLYSIYDTWYRKLLFPFQPCKISIFPEGMPKGIYLANEEDLKITYCGYLYDSKAKSFFWGLSPHPFSKKITELINIYNGPMFFHVFDTFRTGPHTGQSLLHVFRKEPSKIEKYILSGHMYIALTALKELKEIEHINDNNRAFSILLATRDSKLKFESINDLTNEMRGFGAYRSNDVLTHMDFESSWYDEMTFEDVLKKDPQYIISLVELNDINIDNNVLNKLEQHDIFQELSNSLRKQQERLKESYYDPGFERKMLGMDIEDGLREAYNSDPEALWNTD